MRRLLNYIDKNLLLKIASLNSLSVIVRVIVGFLTSKAIAIFVGPSGLALVGNLRDFLLALRSFGSMGFYNGIVKYIAEFKDEAKQQAKVTSTVFFSTLVISGLFSLGCFFGNDALNTLFFGAENNYAFVFNCIALLLPFYSINLLILGYYNGKSRFKFLLTTSIIGQLLAGAVALILIYKFSLIGALISVLIAELMILTIMLIGMRRKDDVRELISKKYFDWMILKKLSSYSLMALVTAALLPLTYVFIRNYLITNIGSEEAGLWEAMNRISKYYLMFISSLLTLYVLPRFSEITTSFEFRMEVFNFYKKIIPIFIIGLFSIYLLRRYIILAVFTDDFLGVEKLFIWQLLGDLVKVLSLVISFQFLAKKMLRPFLISEFISIVVLITSSIYFVDVFGVVGANMAHLFTYIIYYGILLLIFRKSLFGKNEIKIK